MWPWNRTSPADTLHEQILQGNVGCLFAKEAAERDEIAYRTVDASPRASEATVQHALEWYLMEDRKRVLMLLSKHEPRTFAEGREQALKIYGDMVIALRDINQHDVVTLLNLHEDASLPQIFKALPALQLSPLDLRMLMCDAETREQLCESYASNGALAQKYVDAQGCQIRKLFSFAMAPYYEPVTDMPHPRWAPHFCIAVTEQMDINHAIEQRPTDVVRTQKWEQAAAGRRYPQGFHPKP